MLNIRYNKSKRELMERLSLCQNMEELEDFVAILDNKNTVCAIKHRPEILNLHKGAVPFRIMTSILIGKIDMFRHFKDVPDSITSHVPISIQVLYHMFSIFLRDHIDLF